MVIRWIIELITVCNQSEIKDRVEAVGVILIHMIKSHFIINFNI